MTTQLALSASYLWPLVSAYVCVLVATFRRSI
jgi:hypothetical protein